MTDAGLRLDLCLSDIQTLIARQTKQISVSFGIVEAFVAGSPPTVTIGGVNYRYIETDGGDPEVGSVMAVLASAVGTVAMGALAAEGLFQIKEYSEDDADSDDPRVFDLPPGTVEGDLVICAMEFNQQLGIPAAPTGWTIALEEWHDSTHIGVWYAVQTAAGLSTAWENNGGPGFFPSSSGQVGCFYTIKNAGTVGDFQWKYSDVEGSSGGSSFPQVTTTAADSKIFYGIMAAGIPADLLGTFDSGDPGYTGLTYLGTQEFDITTWFFEETQEAIGTSTLRNEINYDNGGNRIEFALVIPPA